MSLTEAPEKVKPKKSYWIEFDHWYCPPCGGEDIYRTRIYDRPKPESWDERHKRYNYMCYKCQYSMFMCF